MNNVLLLFSVAMLLKVGTAQTGCTSGDVQLLLEEQDPMNRIVGFVQYCDDSEWRTICRGGVWTTQEGNVACRQLGYSDQGAAVGSSCDGSATTNSVTINCNGGERSLQECTVQDASCPCTGTGISGDHARLLCQPADCTNREIILVNGTTNREGRVEVCLDGRWGTVCNRINGQEIATSVCIQRGFPSEGALTVDRFGSGTAPIYICVLTGQNMTIDCVPHTTTNCDHSMDLGVMCQKYQELIDQIINQTINETRQECTEPPPVTCDCHMSPVTTQPVSCDECAITNGAASGTTQDGVTTAPLGAVIGVLVVLLVAIVIGWICTCAALKKKLKEVQGHQSHTTKDSTEETYVPVTNIADNPAYQLVNRNQGEESAYEVIDR